MQTLPKPFIYRLFFWAGLLIVSPSLFAQDDPEFISVFENGTTTRTNAVADFVQNPDGTTYVWWESDTDGEPWDNFDSKCHLTYLDDTGTEQWAKEFGTSLYDRSGMLVRVNNALYLAGSGRSYTGGTYPSGHWSVSYLWKTDLDGNELWLNTYSGNSNGQNDGRRVSLAMDGSVVQSGLVQHLSGCSGYAARYTRVMEDGTTSYTHCEGQDDYRASNMHLLPGGDHTVYAAGDTGGFELHKVDADGNVVLAQLVVPTNFPSDETARGDLAVTSNGIVGMVRSSDSDQRFLFMTDSDFQLQWTVSLAESDWFNGSVHVLNDTLIGLVELNVPDRIHTRIRLFDVQGQELSTSPELPQRNIRKIILQGEYLRMCGTRYTDTGGMAVLEDVNWPGLANVLAPGPAEPVIPCYVPQDGLVAWYPFNGNFNDESGNGHHGASTSVQLTSDRFGISGSAAKFGGDGDAVTVANHPDFDFSESGEMTLSYYITGEAFGAGGYDAVALSKQDGSGVTQVGWNVRWNDDWHDLLIGNNGGATLIGTGMPNPALNRTYHVVFTVAPGIMRTYIDGMLVDETETTTPLVASAADLLFGKANWINVNAPPFAGILDDIAIYNRELDACDVEVLFKGGLSDPCANNRKQGDLNCDGQVDAEDILLLIGNYGSAVSP